MTPIEPEILTKLGGSMDKKNNTGMENSGYWNSGYWNSGYRNSGYWNSGDRNSGDRNSGDRNSGDRNSGDWNSGYWNSGSFNTDTPKMRLFNKELDMTVTEFYEKYNISADIPLNRWINKEDMTDQEKKEVAGWETMGGYLKTLEFNEACIIWWDENKSEHDRFLNLPGFDSAIFKEITGIDVDSKIKEMTVKEISEKLGYEVKIIKE